MLIGIDWGGTKIEGIAMSPDGQELLRIRTDTPRGDYRGCLDIIVDLVARLERETGATGSIGIGIPGSLEPDTRLGKGASSTWLLGRPVEQDLTEAIGREIRVENDADCLAASEARDGAGAGYNVVFAVILGSGIGGGVAVGWPGSPRTEQHAQANGGTARCHCHTRSRWSAGRATAARSAAWRHGVRAAASRPSTSVTSERASRPAEIMQRVRDGEPLARLLWERYVDRVGRGLSVVVNTLDPDVFVIGGGMSNVDELYDVLPAAIGRYTFSTVFKTPVLKARHGDSSGVRGAAWLWMDD